MRATKHVPIIYAMGVKQIIDQVDSRDQTVRSVAHLEAIAEPNRYAVYQAVAWAGVSTIREIAETLGRKPASLYRHVARLVGAGLLIEVDEVKTGRRPATRYRARPKLKYDPDDPANARALAQIVERGCRQAAGGFRAAVESQKAITSGPDRDTHFTPPSGWLTPSELARANSLIEELRTLVLGAPRRPGTRLIDLTVTMSPRNVSTTQETT